MSKPLLHATNLPSASQTSLTRIFASLLVVFLVVFVSFFWVLGTPIPPGWRALNYILIAIAFIIIRQRGAREFSPALWLLIIATYPLLAPMLSLDLLGYSTYASGSIRHQNGEAIVAPLLIGGLALVFLALNLSTVQILSSQSDFRADSAKWRPTTILVVFLASTASLLVANILDAPPSSLNLGRVAYSAIKEARDDTLNFATGLVVVCGASMLLSLSILQRVQGISKRAKQLSLISCLLAVLFVSIWQLLSASRVEAIGLLFGLFLTQGDRVSRFTRRMSVFGVVIVFGLVGYLRQLLSFSSFLDRSFVSWPGGIENVFNTYVFAFYSVRAGDIPVFFGQTYLDLLQRLPPGFFGLDRPPRAYDYLAERTRLIGGEYYLTEPFMNGLGLGVAVFLCLLVFTLNSATRVLADFHYHPRRVFSAVISMTLLIFSFRLMWYGFEHTLKTIVIACVLAFPLLALGQRLRKKLRARPQVRSRFNSNL